jgi:anti-sigma factor RsiW
MRLRRRRRPSGHEINCQQAVALVTAYLDGVLSVDDHAKFEAHMRECPMCREHLRQVEATILVTGEMRVQDLDPLAREDLMDLYRRWRDDPSPGLSTQL